MGQKWKELGGLIIIGSAYAGFIEGISSRKYTMPLELYKRSQNPYTFQKYFLERIVQNDSSYYSPIRTFASEFGNLEKIVLFDLCRASFVYRGARDSSRSLDKSGDRVVNQYPGIFKEYVESSIPQNWTWNRITDCGAKCIVALGTIAEHGLLRLFFRKGFRIRDKYKKPLVLGNYHDGIWTRYFAGGPDCKLASWIVNGGNWWVIEGDQHRKWYLLPVYHPSWCSRYDPGYKNTISVLKEMRDHEKGDFICPIPLKWSEIYTSLMKVWGNQGRNKKDEPPIPLILAAWHETSAVMKNSRWNELIRWAEKHQCVHLIPELEENEKVRTEH